ncbi:MAG TPA: ribosome small subunit-dependent GTPase A [Ignavibacteria bacterium]|nr:ribosome small subunit-dependent GTPase A [Ignavibacteria bacterium]
MIEKNSKEILIKFGFDEFFETQFQDILNSKFINEKEFLYPARVSIRHKNHYILSYEKGEIKGEISGKFHFKIDNLKDDGLGYPVVGDWVIVKIVNENESGIIEQILNRKSKFSRLAPGDVTEEQIIISNIDYIFIVSSMNKDYNERRIERYLTMAWENDLKPVLVLNKSDLCTEEEKLNFILKTEIISQGCPVIPVSSKSNENLQELLKYFEGNKSISMIGSSGVGKSSLINSLLGEEKMKVKDITEYKDKGVHTTTHRELILMPGGGVIIDTPGMRTVLMWSGSEGIESAFDDIESLSMQCKFSNCTHTNEPGCAIISALNNGSITKERLKSYRKLQNEIKYNETKQDKKLKADQKKIWKKLTTQGSQRGKNKRGI